MATFIKVESVISILTKSLPNNSQYCIEYMNEKKAAIFLALAEIPSGNVITYGQLAALAGLPGAARLVGTVLSNLPEHTELPWHRVVNSKGKISMPENSASHEEQRRRLAAEGIEFKNAIVNLHSYGYPLITYSSIKSKNL